MSIKDEQVYEASKEILLKFLDKLGVWYVKDLDRHSRNAAKCAKLMADEIDRDDLKIEDRMVDDEDY
jgi:hypothetical protein